MNTTGRPAHLSGRFLFLDGLRGLAALAVALCHFAHPKLSPISGELAARLPAWVSYALANAYLGVEIFFVLSGFVIAHSLWGQRITPRYAGNFAVRRSLRLDPPYWTMIAFAAGAPYLVFPTLLDGFFTGFGGVGGLLANMFYLQDLLKLPAWVGVAWTLCLEVQFYLAYLLLLALAQGVRGVVGSPRAARLIVGAIFAALALYSVHRWFTARENDFGGRWHMFFTGALLYATVAGRAPRWMLGAFVALIAVGGIVYREPHAGVVVGTAVAIYVSTLTGGLRTWLAWRPIQALGHRSYSFYLVHLPVGCTAVTLIDRAGDESNVALATAFFGGLLFSLIAADLLYRYVESPAVRLSARLRPRDEARARGVDARDLATGHVDPSPAIARASP